MFNIPSTIITAIREWNSAFLKLNRLNHGFENLIITRLVWNQPKNENINLLFIYGSYGIDIW